MCVLNRKSELKVQQHVTVRNFLLLDVLVLCKCYCELRYSHKGWNFGVISHCNHTAVASSWSKIEVGHLGTVLITSTLQLSSTTLATFFKLMYWTVLTTVLKTVLTSSCSVQLNISHYFMTNSNHLTHFGRFSPLWCHQAMVWCPPKHSNSSHHHILEESGVWW